MCFIRTSHRGKKISNSRSPSQCNSVQRCCIFELASSVPKASSIIWKFLTDNNKSSELTSSNKDILNSYKSDFPDVASLRNFIFTHYFSAFVLFLLLLKESRVDPYRFLLLRCAKFYSAKHSLL